MVDFKQAVTTAREFISLAYGKPLDDLQLEEIRKSEDGKYWLITLGFSKAKWEPDAPLTPALTNFLRKPQAERVYKVIKVNKDSGEAEAMEIREV